MKRRTPRPGDRPVLIDTPMRLEIMEGLFAAMGIGMDCMIWAERWADDNTLELCFGSDRGNRPVIRIAMTRSEARLVAGWLHPRDEE